MWLDGQVKRPDGTLDLEKLYAVAERYGIDKRYDRLNAKPGKRTPRPDGARDEDAANDGMGPEEDDDSED